MLVEKYFHKKKLLSYKSIIAFWLTTLIVKYINKKQIFIQLKRNMILKISDFFVKY